LLDAIQSRSLHNVREVLAYYIYSIDLFYSRTYF
jgi:hypothetical protein